MKVIINNAKEPEEGQPLKLRAVVLTTTALLMIRHCYAVFLRAERLRSTKNSISPAAIKKLVVVKTVTQGEAGRLIAGASPVIKPTIATITAFAPSSSLPSSQKPKQTHSATNMNPVSRPEFDCLIVNPRVAPRNAKSNPRSNGFRIIKLLQRIVSEYKETLIKKYTTADFLRQTKKTPFGAF